MKTFLCCLVLNSWVLFLASAANDNPKHYTMVTSFGSWSASKGALVKIYDGDLDSTQRRDAKPDSFDSRKAFFEFLRSIPRKSTIHWTTYCNPGTRFEVGEDTVLKKDLVERLKEREIVLQHRTEFF